MAITTCLLCGHIRRQRLRKHGSASRAAAATAAADVAAATADVAVATADVAADVPLEATAPV